MISLVKRALDHYENKTTDQAPDVMSNSIDAYILNSNNKEELEIINNYLIDLLFLIKSKKLKK